MEKNYDVVVIGSGFGGSVMAYRLAVKGYRVLVLERGRRWEVDDYPRGSNDDWIYDPDEPHQQNGWLDLRFMDDMIVAQGAGIGGGSLIYANISVDAPEQVFNQGWPSEINFETLRPYYARVSKALGLHVLPDNQLTERFKLMREGAGKLGHSDRFCKLPMAVTFGNDWHYGLDNPFDNKWSKEWTNEFGKKQGTCIHLGNCDIGCDVKAKNTLDLNYLAGAEKNGAEILALHVVRTITPQLSGYSVEYDRIDKENKRITQGSVTAGKVVLAAGSLGSTELLYRCRDQYKTLPDISRRLGMGWSSNGDFLTPAFYKHRKINPTHGPTISCAIDFLDGSEDNERYFIEDGGFPDLLQNYLEDKTLHGIKKWRYKKVLRSLRKMRAEHPSLDGVMPWFAQGIDAADGRLYLGRKWYAPWKRKLKLDWDIERSEAVIEAIISMHKRLSDVTDADSVWVPPTWTLLRNLVTPHPLGGCNMGNTIEDGVVDHLGRVFGYPGLHVVDGAIIPEAIGRNPSKTIAALAERIAEHIDAPGGTG